MMQAIRKEIEMRSAGREKQLIDTLYLGGGTPSMIEWPLMEGLFETINRCFTLDTAAEITLEANPDDITITHLNEWKKAGINRLSIGIQSFRDDDLKYLNRVHSAQKTVECIKLAQLHGFPDLTIDLIFGIPTLDNEQWLNNLAQFSQLNIPHLSAYALTVEPRTPLFQMIEKGEVKPVDEQQTSEQFELLVKYMQENNYLHYEISNFCKPGHFARHNLSYWQGIEYYGFGPSAHSFNGKARQWNVSSIQEYIAGIEKGEPPCETELLSPADHYNEFVMTGLRTMWGCDINQLNASFGSDMADYFKQNAQKWIDRSLMYRKDDLFLLTNEGKLRADGIASDLFIV